MPSKRPLRVAMVQLDSKLKQVGANIARATLLTNSIQPGSVDLVCFPEMAFTGYVFPSFGALEPFLESPPEGPTSNFCSALAKRLRCFVVAGYPQKLLPSDVKIALSPTSTSLVDASSSTNKDTLDVTVAGNCAALFGPEGELIGQYRKTNLYEADLPWAQAGTGFTTFDLPPPLGRISIVICMDLNPNVKESDYLSPDFKVPYEVADYCIAQNVNALIVLCAWKASDYDKNSERDIGTVNYWCHRLAPLWQPSSGESQETTVIICDRAGSESGTLFAGSSTIMKLQRNSGKPNIVGVMKRAEEACRIWTVD